MNRLLPLLIILLFLSGCGYSTVKRNASPLYGRLLHVNMFVNGSYQPNLDGELRLALLDEIAKSGTGELAAEQAADVTLSGEIESLVLENAAFSASDKAMKYRFVLTVQAVLTERRSGTVFWKSKEIVREEYPANADMALQRNSRDAAITASCREMARRLVTQMNRAF